MNEVIIPSGVDTFQLHKYEVRTGLGALKTMVRVIEEYDVGRLALIGNDYPYIFPMNHYYKDGKLFWHCAFVGKKFDLVRKNSKACYIIDGSIKPFVKKIRYRHQPWLSVICYGNIDEVQDPEERLPILQEYSKRQGGPAVSMERAKTCNLLRFTIEKMTGRYGRFTPAENRHLLYWNFVEHANE